MFLYTTFLYQPVLNLFVGLYYLIPEAGAVIIIMTILVRLLLYPFYKKQVQAQKSMQDLQPKLAEVKHQYKDDKEAQAKAMMQLYKDNKVNPFASCLPVLIQLPLFIAVYQVLRDGLTQNGNLNLLYDFIPRPEVIHPVFLGLIDLSKPFWLLALLAGAAQYWQAKMLVTKPAQVKTEGSKDEDMAAMMNKQMLYLMPIFIVVFGMTLPSGLSLYWLVSTLFMVGQQYIAFSKQQGPTKIDEKTEVLPKP